MTPPQNSRTSHKSLIAYALFGIGACAFGIGFAVRKEVSERLRRLPDDCDPKERKELMTAQSLAEFGVIMSIMTWLGLFMMIFVAGKPKRSGSSALVESKPETYRSASVQSSH